MQRGGSAADVWVVSDDARSSRDDAARPAAPLRPRRSRARCRAAPPTICFWLGRYVERAEGAMRLLRACTSGSPRPATARRRCSPISPTSSTAIGVDRRRAACPTALRAILRSAIFSASHVRDRFSVDGWMALNDLAQTAGPHGRDGRRPATTRARAMGVLLRKITGFSGLVHENMYRFVGLALPVDRPLARAGAGDGRARCAALARPGRARRRARPRGRGRRQRDDAPPALRGRDHPRDGGRPARARRA